MLLYQGTLIGTSWLGESFWQGCTRVRWLVYRTLIGIPNADWHTFETQRWITVFLYQGTLIGTFRLRGVVLAGLYQDTLIGTPNANWYTKCRLVHFRDTKMRHQGETPGATPRRRAANRRGRHQDAERQIAKGNTETQNGKLPRTTPRRQGQHQQQDN